MEKEPIQYDSTINCVITNIGLEKCQEAADNEGWHIYPTTFSISDEQGEFSSYRTDLKPTWYQNVISSRKVLDPNTIEFICDVPVNASTINRDIKEVYLLAEDNNHNQFLLCLCHTSNLVFIPNVSIKLRIRLNIINLDVISIYKFMDTCAIDVEEHNNDPLAHEDLRNQIQNAVGDTIITSDSNIQAMLGNNYLVNSKENLVNINLPIASLTTGAKITIIDVGHMAHLSPITINAGTKTIDNSSKTLILNVAGSAVTLIWYSRLDTWCIDIGGRLNTPLFKEKNDRDLYYTNYFNSGISKYLSTENYEIGSIVLGNDNNLYQCIVNNGPGYIISSPLDTTDKCWVPLSSDRTIFMPQLPIKKNTAISTFQYLKGKDKVSVYIDGLLSMKGSDDSSCTWYEDSSIANGYKANKIYFHDDIPNTFEVCIIRE